MPDLPAHPMRVAVDDLMQVMEGVHGTLASIEACNPGPDANDAQQAAFLNALVPVIAEAQLSLALASGALAHCLRRHRGSKLN